MELIVKELDETNIGDLGKIDGHFTIDSRLLLFAEANQIHYTVIEIPSSAKRYGQEIVDYQSYINNSARVIFLVYVDGSTAGQIRLRENWNNFAYVEDIAVDVGFRRLGVGRTLIEEAKRWARQRRLPGLMLETQDNNVQACRFYERCGFKIGGFDNALYKGQKGDTDEVAIFWYLLFEQ